MGQIYPVMAMTKTTIIRLIVYGAKGIPQILFFSYDQEKYIAIMQRNKIEKKWKEMLDLLSMMAGWLFTLESCRWQ